MNPDSATPQPPAKRKLSTHEYIYAGLPIILVAIGGAIGGAAGGCAFVYNVKIFQREMAAPKKYLLSALVSLGACVAYVLAAGLLAIAFPSIFRK